MNKVSHAESLRSVGVNEIKQLKRLMEVNEMK